MLDWNPALYRRFEEERTRPAEELLARVPLGQAGPGIHVVDLGCGPGNSTELLVRRFPEARVTGVDNSAAMLASARERLPGVTFEHGDIATWAPAAAPHLIYANAALQWVGGHDTLVPRLFRLLAPGGLLAIQMPDNRQEPSHRLMRAVAAETPWREAIGDADSVRTDLASIAGYYDMLAPHAAQVDVWHTVYQHVVPSARAIVDWLRSTGLRPFLDPLTDALRESFLAEYERRISDAYPERADGSRLLGFPRMFIVAQRRPS